MRLVVFLIALILVKAPSVSTLNKTRNLKNEEPVAVKVVNNAAPTPETVGGGPVAPAAPVAEVSVETPAAPIVPTPAPTLSHDQLMSLAGISQSDWPSVDYIVSHESGWNPDATEPTSGAHGLVQALPYSKTGCGWDDAVCQLEWGQTYAVERYGGWLQAYVYWIVHHNW